MVETGLKMCAACMARPEYLEYKCDVKLARVSNE